MGHPADERVDILHRGGDFGDFFHPVDKGEIFSIEFEGARDFFFRAINRPT